MCTYEHNSQSNAFLRTDELVITLLIVVLPNTIPDEWLWEMLIPIPASNTYRATLAKCCPETTETQKKNHNVYWYKRTIFKILKTVFLWKSDYGAYTQNIYFPEEVYSKG